MAEGDRRAHAGVATGTANAYDPTVVTEYLSVLATSWLQALGPHLRALVVPPHRLGHSHAIAAVVLAVFAIESLAARLMLLKHWEGGDSAAVFLYRGLVDFPRPLAHAAHELFVVRNSLVHNHIWRMRGTSSGDGFTAEGIERLAGRTPLNDAPVVSADRRLTLPHGLNLVPELVGYSDVRTTMEILVAVLDAFAAADVKNMPSAVDLVRVDLGAGGIPPLRRFSRMPRAQPLGPWPPKRGGRTATRSA